MLEKKFIKIYLHLPSNFFPYLKEIYCVQKKLLNTSKNICIPKMFIDNGFEWRFKGLMRCVHVYLYWVIVILYCHFLYQQLILFCFKGKKNPVDVKTMKYNISVVVWLWNNKLTLTFKRVCCRKAGLFPKRERDF